jgi:hypothetical protein
MLASKNASANNEGEAFAAGSPLQSPLPSKAFLQQLRYGTRLPMITSIFRPMRL